MSKKISRNALCPCDSGKKYKRCCWDKNFDWIETADDELGREVPIPPELVEILKAHRQDFIEKHGREPRPDEPLFPDMQHPEYLEAEMVEIVRQSGAPPDLVYAVEKTGRIVTDETYKNLTDAELHEWDNAIEEYFDNIA